MAFDNTITVIGNLTREPELKYTASGTAVCSFSVAWNRKDQNQADVASFFDVTCWRELAEYTAESLTKGQRVIIHGRLEQESWEKDGEKRTKIKIVAEDVGASMRWSAVGNVERPAPKPLMEKSTTNLKNRFNAERLFNPN